MRIRVLGGGWYGCHIAAALIDVGHSVQLHESQDRLFMGASGGNPARLHRGFHYPRSRLTRAACLEHAEAFMARYGHLTRSVPVNLYAVAADDSLMDFGTYRQVLAGEVEFLTVEDPEEFGLRHCEGALLTGERHIVIDEARAFFEELLGPAVHLNTPATAYPDGWDWTVDCTFCAQDAEAIDRFEPCLTVLLEGPTDRAVTVMDGPFPSIYPWNEEAGLCSLTSALHTPFSKTCQTWSEARAILRQASAEEMASRAVAMLNQIGHFWPEALDRFSIADLRTAIRAMPRSGAAARLVDVVERDRTLRVRAGKIDAVFAAEAIILERIQFGTPVRLAS